MAKTLGLDLGTNSIGWALIDNEKEGNQIENKGVLIFPQGVKSEKGKESSKAAERTGYRSARRLNFRRKLRKYETLLVLAKNNMCPLNVEEVKEWRRSNFKEYPDNPEFLKWLKTDEDNNINPYYFRDKSSREKTPNLELGRALYHIAQRRGFLSNRLDQSDKGVIEKQQPGLKDIIDNSLNNVELQKKIDEFFKEFDLIKRKAKDLDAGEKKLKKLYNVFKKIIAGEKNTKLAKEQLLERLFKRENLGVVKGGISDLDEKIENAADCETLGQYFWKIYNEDVKSKDNKIRTLYTAREDHYLKEFEAICKVQGFEGINYELKDPSSRYAGIVKDLYRAIFYQRPLKSQKGLVGKCTLEPTKARCPLSRPEFEEYRMYSFINNIKIKTSLDEKLRFLTPEERELIIPKFHLKSKPTFTFEDLKSKLGKDHFYNYKDKATVTGCPTITSLINVFGDNWKEQLFDSYTDKDIRDRKTKRVIGSKTQSEVIADVWHVLATFTSNEKLETFAIEKLQLNKEDAERFSKINLKAGYASLSLLAINKILVYLKAGLIVPSSIFMANMDKVIVREKWENEDDRKLIENSVIEIFDNHNTENRINFIINSVLRNCFDNNFAYSKEAESSYKTDLNKSFETEFGKDGWDNKLDKTKTLADAFKKFIEHLESREFVTTQRTDEKIIAFLKNKGFLNTNTSEELYHPSDIETFKPVTIEGKNNIKYKGLGSPIVGSIKNPMALKTLHQLRKLINTLIVNNEIDEKTKVHIELVRELNDSNKRKAIEKWQKDREKLHKKYEEEIKELYKKKTGSDINPTKDDILKYQLWKEQNHVCLYKGTEIDIINFLGAKPTYDIEHTIPRSRSWDNSQKNKTLCESDYNRKIKGNKIPFELDKHADILKLVDHWRVEYEALYEEIEALKRFSKSATDKEQKDRIIQKRHYLKMDHDYLKGKYNTFIMEEVKQGFKNSQYTDTGIITKYAVSYMKSVFPKVYSVKGEMVSEYRKAWDLQGSNSKNKGPRKYLPKNRNNHIHHCIDAITIACMHKGMYDKMAYAWGLEDKGKYKDATDMLAKSKPWKTFTEDVKNFENEVLIVYREKDVLPIQTKKKLRKEGKIQRNKKGDIIFQQGDGARGSLHNDTFYGAIAKDIDGNVKTDKEGEIIPNYVIRKELSKLNSKDIDNIVDENIREILRKAKEDGVIKFGNEGATIDEIGIWQNEDKQIPIKKVRIFAHITNPLKDFKKHSKPFLSKVPYKQQFNVANGGNHCIAIYEGNNKKGKMVRGFEIVNHIDAGEYFRLSNKQHREEHGLVPKLHEKHNIPFKFILKKGMMVLMYDEKPEEIWKLKEKGNNLIERLYKLAKIDSSGRLAFRPHNGAKRASDLKQVSKVDFSTLQEQISLSVSNLNILVEGRDFKLTLTGEVVKL